MKNFIYIVPGGGIFSRLLQFGILPLSEIDFDNVYLELSGFVPVTETNDEFSNQAWKFCEDHVNRMQQYGIEDPYAHILDYILVQKKDASYEHRGFLKQGTTYTKQNKIELSPNFSKYQKVITKLKFQPEVYNKLNSLPVTSQITNTTLGVHVRLTSMNMLHGDQYQNISLDEYKRCIAHEFETGKYSNIFVASDNHESIYKLQAYFGDLIIYHDNFLRYKTETFSSFFDCLAEYDWFYQKRFWQEAMAEVMSLSRVGALICRESNLSNMAIVLSNSMNKIIRVSKNV